MTSAFHRPEGRRAGAESRFRRMTWRLHPVLSDVLNRLEGTALGQSFNDRAVEVATSAVFSEPVDHGAALAAHRWVLDRAQGDGLPLTAAGYLRPADVQEIAAMLPTMRDWPSTTAREIDAHPVRAFREHLKEIGLLRNYKRTLRLTKAGREVQSDPVALWSRLAGTLLPAEGGFDAHASTVVLVHMATTEGKLDTHVIAKTLTGLGWSHRDGSPVSSHEVHSTGNRLWVALGNVGERAGGTRRSDRPLSAAAGVLVHDALFEQAGPS